MRFLALGDSYTIGESVGEAEQWPRQLARWLGEEGIDLREVSIIARTGWTTAELAAGIEAAGPGGIYDLVSLLIGVNNQYRGLDQEEYRREFVALLKQAIALAGGQPNHVLVLSIPDWSVTPFAAGRDRAAVAAEIDGFNRINREEAERLGTHYVDVTLASRRAADDPALIAEDGLHPSGRMYTEWARLLLPMARQIL
jgi:lysophospholipase L1-like esterase